MSIRYDPTVNLGHILTFLGFMAAGSAGYFDLRERIAINELKVAQVANEQAAEKIRIRESLLEIRDDMREMRDDMRQARKGIEQLTEGKR